MNIPTDTVRAFYDKLGHGDVPGGALPCFATIWNGPRPNAFPTTAALGARPRKFSTSFSSRSMRDWG